MSFYYTDGEIGLVNLNDLFSTTNLVNRRGWIWIEIFASMSLPFVMQQVGKKYSTPELN